MNKNTSKAIWEKQGKDTVSARLYALALGSALSWAVFLVAIGAHLSSSWRYGPGLVLLTFVLSIAGIIIFTSSEKPGRSVLGVSILSFFMGLSIGPVVAYYQAEVVIQALVLTFAVTVGMAILGILMPNVIAKFAGVLFLGLLILLVGYFSATILALFGITSGVFGVLDWLSLAIFSLYIWFDWGRAMKLPKTIDNAIDVSGALIVDIVNLFLTLLRVVARSS